MSSRKHLPVCLGVFAFCFVVAVYVIPNVDQTLWFTGIRSYARQKVDPAILSREHQGRRETIQKFCGNQPPSYNISQNIYRYFSFSKRHRLLYCGIQKVGTSFLLRVMKLLIGRVGEGELFNKSFLHGRGMQGKASFSDERNTPETIHKILENYDHKFFFVRDPFSRLFSAYMDKVFLPDHRMLAIARRGGLTREEEEGGGESSRQCLLNVTFQTFLEVVTSHKKNDPHWLPMHRHCDPCNVRFHYVGKMETFRADLEFILGQAGVDLDLLSPDRDSFDSDTDLRALQDLAKQYYSKARASLCPAETYMCRVMEKIWITLQTRGFLSIKVPYPFPAKDCLAYNQTTFMDTLVAAYRQSATHEARMHQRKEAMMEAYYRLPADLLKRAEDYVRDDCAMFGYNCSVEARFPQGGLRELQYSYFGSYA
ncbi:carbohydrate sulfotransferase 13-like [Littorina saxatilis]|uniref:Carbohydrate sulfotransferase n=1 Tax=Littorina saxatilis TaxID=31220 RepID=A0AAN9FYL1_9CAEN